MVRIANFEKVSYEQFYNDFTGEYIKDEITPEIEESIKSIYDLTSIPIRSTTLSAGYDFFSPFSFELQPGESIKIPTAIKCKMDEGWVLFIMMRSSVGIKYGIMPANVIPVIDGDYYYAKNEGHIWIVLVNHGDKIWKVNAGDKIAQGVLVPFGITYDDNIHTEREGGIGSTGV